DEIVGTTAGFEIPGVGVTQEVARQGIARVRNRPARVIRGRYGCGGDRAHLFLATHEAWAFVRASAHWLAKSAAESLPSNTCCHLGPICDSVIEPNCGR